ncbi:MAG TPA: ATP-binding cassette domain-containing protein [Lachnospiraceae bacterium]|nr:ATP-binding cassette domain-containing protein [Lachnospiraceae bacterium]
MAFYEPVAAEEISYTAIDGTWFMSTFPLSGVLFGNRTELWWDHPVIQSLEMVTDLLDISGLLKTFARELSLGKRMRADLAMMLLHSPKLILPDEPTLGLDVVAKRQMIDFLKKINRENGVHEYEADLSKIPIKTLMSFCLNLMGSVMLRSRKHRLNR